MSVEPPVFIVRLIGGLGNQLFQIQYGIGLIKKWGGKLFFDDSFFLLAKQMHEVLSSDSLIKNYDIITLGFFRLKVIRSFQRLAYKLGIRLPEVFSPYFLFSHDEHPHTSSNIYIVDGFWQSKEFLNEEFLQAVREQLLIQYHEVDAANICVHIRRGDYLTNPHALVLNMEYYEKAINLFANEIENPRFYIFSDDPAWVSENLQMTDPYRIMSFSSQNDPIVDLTLMSKCKHNIIANSTFSWWAAWLNNNKFKIVIGPSKWYQKNSLSESMYPQGWLTI